MARTISCTLNHGVALLLLGALPRSGGCSTFPSSTAAKGKGSHVVIPFSCQNHRTFFTTHQHRLQKNGHQCSPQKVVLHFSSLFCERARAPLIEECHRAEHEYALTAFQWRFHAPASPPPPGTSVLPQFLQHALHTLHAFSGGEKSATNHPIAGRCYRSDEEKHHQRLRTAPKEVHKAAH